MKIYPLQQFRKLKGRKVTVPELRGGAEIMRDGYGIPHIYAQETEELFFALGYAMAEDRLWQMDVTRRMARGTLSEIAGPVTLEQDRFARTLGLGRLADAEVGRLDRESRGILESFCDGINFYIETHRWNLPIEFVLLRYRPGYWTMSDSLAIGKLMGWILPPYLDSLLLVSDTSEKIGKEFLSLLLPDLPQELPATEGPPIDGWNELAWREGAYRAMVGSGQGGSNNWVVNGTRTITGKPLLANDPHLFIENPSRWYEAHLCGGGFNVAGAMLPGAPFVVFGHNEHIAWGVTHVGAIAFDLYREKTNPENPRQCLYKDQWEDMRVVREQIVVRGQGAVDLEVSYTRHGPLVWLGQDGEGLAWRWVGAEHTEESVALLELNRARNWQDFTAALSHFAVPAQNFVYADKEGHIGYYCTGWVPIRRGHGAGPVPGWTGDYEWEGYIPFEEMPHSYNPPEGWLGTANHKVVDDDYPYTITWAWIPPYRHQRIAELLQAGNDLSVARFAQMQADLLSPLARELTPKIIEVLNDERDPKAREGLEYLKRWDYRIAGDSVAAAIFEVFYHYFFENVLRARLDMYLTQRWLAFAAFVYLNAWELAGARARGGEPWLPGRKRDEIVRSSFSQAIAFLTHRLGSDMAQWQWHRLHRVAFRHPMGRFPLLNRLLNFGPYPYDGDGDTLCMSEYFHTTPYDAAVVPSFRLIIDLADFDNSLACNSTGQSGRPFGCNYGDQIPDWLSRRYHPMPFSREAVEAQAKSRLLLEPKHPPGRVIK